MKQAFYPIAAAFVLGSTYGATAATSVFTANFETDQAGSFTTAIASSTNDANANFAYDSSTHVQANGPAITIGAAPGSATTKVLRLNANLVDTADTDSINVYPNAGTLTSNFAMTADTWQNYNGPAAGGTGSTNMMLIGATSSKTIAARAQTAPSIAGDGFYFAITGENGATADYRYYSGTGTIAANNAGATFLGGTSGADPAWTNFFATPTYETAGTPGKAWTAFKLVVSGGNAVLYAKRAADTDFTQIASASGVPATAVNPFIGFGDINTGLASPVSDQFLLVDNVTVETFNSAVNEWSLYH